MEYNEAQNLLTQAQTELNEYKQSQFYQDPSTRDDNYVATLNTAINKLTRLIHMKDSISAAQQSVAEAQKANDAADKYEQKANLDPVQRGLVAAGQSAAGIIAGVPSAVSSVALGAGGTLARGVGMENLGKAMQNADSYVQEKLDVGNPFEGYEGPIGAIGGALHGFAGFAVPAMGVGKLSGKLSAGLGELAKSWELGAKATSRITTGARLLGDTLGFGAMSLKNESDKIEAQRGKFSIGRSLSAAGADSLLMSVALMVGSGHGLTNDKAIEYGLSFLNGKGVLKLTKEAFKNAMRGGLANGILSGAVGTTIKEALALPDNPTDEDYERIWEAVKENVPHATVTGAALSAHSAVSEYKSAKDIYNKLGSTRAKKLSSSSQLSFDKSLRELGKEYPDMWTAAQTPEKIAEIQQRLTDRIPSDLDMKDRAPINDLIKDVGTMLHANANSASRLGKELIDGRNKADKEVTPTEKILENIKSAKKTISEIDEQIAKEKDLVVQQQLVRQKETTIDNIEKYRSDMEHPYTFDDIVRAAFNGIGDDATVKTLLAETQQIYGGKRFNGDEADRLLTDIANTVASVRQAETKNAGSRLANALDNVKKSKAVKDINTSMNQAQTGSNAIVVNPQGEALLPQMQGMNSSDIAALRGQMKQTRKAENREKSAASYPEKTDSELGLTRALAVRGVTSPAVRRGENGVIYGEDETTPMSALPPRNESTEITDETNKPRLLGGNNINTPRLDYNGNGPNVVYSGYDGPNPPPEPPSGGSPAIKAKATAKPSQDNSSKNNSTPAQKVIEDILAEGKYFRSLYNYNFNKAIKNIKDVQTRMVKPFVAKPSSEIDFDGDIQDLFLGVHGRTYSKAKNMGGNPSYEAGVLDEFLSRKLKIGTYDNLETYTQEQLKELLNRVNNELKFDRNLGNSQRIATEVIKKYLEGKISDSPKQPVKTSVKSVKPTVVKPAEAKPVETKSTTAQPTVKLTGKFINDSRAYFTTSADYEEGKINKDTYIANLNAVRESFSNLIKNKKLAPSTRSTISDYILQIDKTLESLNNPNKPDGTNGAKSSGGSKAVKASGKSSPAVKSSGNKAENKPTNKILALYNYFANGKNHDKELYWQISRYGNHGYEEIEYEGYDSESKEYYFKLTNSNGGENHSVFLETQANKLLKAMGIKDAKSIVYSRTTEPTTENISPAATEKSDDLTLDKNSRGNLVSPYVIQDTIKGQPIEGKENIDTQKAIDYFLKNNSLRLVRETFTMNREAETLTIRGVDPEGRNVSMGFTIADNRTSSEDIDKIKNYMRKVSEEKDAEIIKNALPYDEARRLVDELFPDDKRVPREDSKDNLIYKKGRTYYVGKKNINAFSEGNGVNYGYDSLEKAKEELARYANLTRKDYEDYSEKVKNSPSKIKDINLKGNGIDDDNQTAAEVMNVGKRLKPNLKKEKIQISLEYPTFVTNNKWAFWLNELKDMPNFDGVKDFNPEALIDAKRVWPKDFEEWNINLPVLSPKPAKDEISYFLLYPNGATFLLNNNLYSGQNQILHVSGKLRPYSVEESKLPVAIDANFIGVARYFLGDNLRLVGTGKGKYRRNTPVMLEGEKGRGLVMPVTWDNISFEEQIHDYALQKGFAEPNFRKIKGVPHSKLPYSKEVILASLNKNSRLAKSGDIKVVVVDGLKDVPGFKNLNLPNGEVPQDISYEKDGVTYIVRENIPDGMALETVSRHAIGAHLGAPKILGEKEYSKLCDYLANSKDKEIQSLADTILAEDSSVKLGSDKLGKEIFARVFEKGLNEPATLKGKIKQLWQDIKFFFKRGLRRLGYNGDISEDELQAAMRYVFKKSLNRGRTSFTQDVDRITGVEAEAINRTPTDKTPLYSSQNMGTDLIHDNRTKDKILKVSLLYNKNQSIEDIQNGKKPWGSGFEGAVYGRNGLAGALLTGSHNTTSPNVITKDRKSYRQLTAREMGRLMGFPEKDLDKIEGKLNDRQTQFVMGNSVVVPVAKSVMQDAFKAVGVKKKPTVISFFSGVGAFESALDEMGGYNLARFSEINPNSIKAYTLMHGQPESKNVGDISKAKPESFPKNADLLTFGFPCQDLTPNGAKKGYWLEDGSYSRSGLFFAAADIIEKRQPKIAIAENSSNLINPKFFNPFKERMEKAGYNVYAKVINAAEFGVPQHRERTFAVAIRKDLDNGSFRFSEGNPKTARVPLNTILESDKGKKTVPLDKAKINAIHGENPLYRMATKEEEDELNKDEYVYTYRNMQVLRVSQDKDGKWFVDPKNGKEMLFPPIAAYFDANAGKTDKDGKPLPKKMELVEPSLLKKWYRSDERYDNVKRDENGNVVIRKGHKPNEFDHAVIDLNKYQKEKKNGEAGTTKALRELAFNAYFHSKSTPWNFQFTEAGNRPNLVVVEMAIPKKDLESGYRAKYSKNAVGYAEWKSDTVSDKLSEAGVKLDDKLILSRWGRIERIVPNEEVADKIAELFGNSGVGIPENRVVPAMKPLLEARGIKILPPDTKLKGDKPLFRMAGPSEQVSAKTVEETYGKEKDERKFDGIKKRVLRTNLADFEEKNPGTFRTQKRPGYTVAALRSTYFTGYDIGKKKAEGILKQIRVFGRLKEGVREYIKANLPDSKVRAKMLDKLVKTQTREGVLALVPETNTLNEQYIRQQAHTAFIRNMRDLGADKISAADTILKLDELKQHFTQEELDGLLKTDDFTKADMIKVRNVAKIANKVFASMSDNTDLAKSDFQVMSEGARQTAEKLNDIIENMNMGDSAKVPTETLVSINNMLHQIKVKSDLAKQQLVKDAKNKAFEAQKQIRKEMKPIDEKFANSKEGKSIGIFQNYLKPGSSLSVKDNDNFFRDMGPTMRKLGSENIRKGQSVMEHHLAKGNRVIDKIFEDFGGDRGLKEKFITKKTDGGHTYNLDMNDAMYISAMWNDRETRAVIRRKGKVAFELGEKPGSETIEFTVAELEKLDSQLSELQKNSIAAGKKLLLEYLPELNRVREKLEGVPFRTILDGTYAPRVHIGEGTETSSLGVLDAMSAPFVLEAKNADWIPEKKMRNKFAIPKFRLRGWTNVLETYKNHASLYIGMAEPLRELNRVYDRDMKRDIIQRYGKEYASRLEMVVRHEAGQAKKTPSDKNIMQKYLSNIAAAKLTPLSALKQFTSIPLASSIIDKKYLFKALTGGISKENIEDMMSLDSMSIRYRDGITGVHETGARNLEERHALASISNSRFIKGALSLSLEADKRALGIIFKAAKLQAEAEGKGRGRAVELFQKAVDRTQNTTDLANANGFQLMSRESTHWAFLNMYLNQTQKIPNEIMRLYRDVKEAEQSKNKEGLSEAKGRLVDFIISVALMEAGQIGVTAAAASALGRKNDDTVQDVAVNAVTDLIGNPILKPAVSGYNLKNVLNGRKPTTSNVFGNDISDIAPNVAYDFQQVKEGLENNDIRKTVESAIGSKAVQSALAIGKIPPFLVNYPAQIIKNYFPKKKAKKQAPKKKDKSFLNKKFWDLLSVK